MNICKIWESFLPNPYQICIKNNLYELLVLTSQVQVFPIFHWCARFKNFRTRDDNLPNTPPFLKTILCATFSSENWSKTEFTDIYYEQSRPSSVLRSERDGKRPCTGDGHRASPTSQPKIQGDGTPGWKRQHAKTGTWARQERRQRQLPMFLWPCNCSSAALSLPETILTAAEAAAVVPG